MEARSPPAEVWERNDGFACCVRGALQYIAATIACSRLMYARAKTFVETLEGTQFYCSAPHAADHSDVYSLARFEDNAEPIGKVSR